MELYAQRMKRLRWLVLIGMVTLTSCTSAQPEPSASVAQNAKACASFEKVTKDLAARIVAGSDASTADEFKRTMDAMPARFDAAALQGEGDVKVRIELLISALPDPVHMLYIESDDYFTNVERVVRACEADGSAIQPAGWR